MWIHKKEWKKKLLFICKPFTIYGKVFYMRKKFVRNFFIIRYLLSRMFLPSAEL